MEPFTEFGTGGRTTGEGEGIQNIWKPALRSKMRNKICRWSVEASIFIKAFILNLRNRSGR